MFWTDKRVLVTGHTGFKGGWLVLSLEQAGANVTGYSTKPPSTPSLFETARIAESITSLEGNVCSLEDVKHAVVKTNPEVVMHLAGQPLVLHGYEHPVETFATNIMGTVHVLEALRSAPSVRVVVIVTTDKCYLNNEWDKPFVESDILGGHDPYSASKAAAEMVTAAYRHSFFPLEKYTEHRIAVATVRAGNMIGGGDWGAHRLIPDVVRAFARDKSVVRLRSPEATRPWQHVLDGVNGYLMLAERMWSDSCFADAWNFGPSDDDTKPVAWVVDRIANLWGDGAHWEQERSNNSANSAPRESTALRLDSSKARSRLGWRPKLNLPTALEWTVEWYKAHHAGRNMRTVTLEQLKQYQDLVGKG